MGNYPAYPAYKDSGVEWLGQIPSCWNAVRLKRVTTLAYGDSLPAEKRTDGDIEVFGSNGPVGTHDEANTKGPVIVVGRKGSFGRLTFSSRPSYAIDTTYFIDQDCTRNDLRWLYYAMNCLGLDAQSKDSAVPGLSREEAYAKFVPLPPLPEQQAIARFLDHKTAQIDALIAKQEALLVKLAEKRTALISHAVTKGLDPTVPMKDSGIEWLGEIPAYWQLKRLRFVLTTNPNKHKFSLPEDALVSFVPMEAVGEYGGLTLDTEKSLDEIGSGYTYFAEDDVVVAKITPCFENGKGAIAQGLTSKVGFGTTELHVLRAGQELQNRFLFYLTISHVFRKIGEAHMYGAAGQKRVPDLFIKDFRIGIPSLSEQESIVNFIDSGIAQIDALVAKAQAVIDKLKEYRTALITHAVTGQIDVRNVLLPETPDTELAHA